MSYRQLLPFVTFHPNIQIHFQLFQIMNILQQLILTKEKTEMVGDTFINEVNLALTEQPSSLQMENTYIPELPNGTGSLL